MSDARTEKEIITEAYSDDAAKNWRAPVQGYPPGIPWPLHLEAYEAYAKKWTKQAALIDLKGRGCRGGFGIDELNDFVPGWRERVSYIGRLEARLAELEALPTAPVTAGQPSRPAYDDDVYRASDALLGTLWQSVWSGARTHEQNWEQMDRKYPQARWLHDALKALAQQPPKDTP